MKRLLLSTLFPITIILFLLGSSKPTSNNNTSLCIEESLLTNRKARPFKKLVAKKAFVVHGTGNERLQAGAYYHIRYFDLGLRKASYHYIIDSENIIRIIPDNEVSFNCGALEYTKLGQYLFVDGLPPNYSTISVGICVNGDYEKAEGNAIKLLSELITIHGYLPIYRHFDITGKSCPEKLLDLVEWERFKNEVYNYHKAKFL